MSKRERFLFGKIGNERGRSTENLIFQAVNRCIESGNIPAWLIGYEKATPKDDSLGIDGWLHTDVGKIPLQVKSSIAGKQKFTERKSHIPIVVIQVGQSDEQILAKCVSAIAPKRTEYLLKRQK